MTGESSPARPSRDSRKENSPPAASVALVMTVVWSRSKSSSRRIGARSRGTAWRPTCIPRVLRSIHRTVGGPPATGRSVRLRPSDTDSSRRITARSSWRIWPRRSDSSDSASRSAMVSTVSASDRKAPSVASSSYAETLGPDLIAREVVSEAKLARRYIVEASVEPGEERVGGPPGIRKRGQEAVPRGGRDWRGSAGRRDRPARPPGLARGRGRCARTARAGAAPYDSSTWMPRWLAATSSR